MKGIPWGEIRRLVVCRTDHLGDLVVSSGTLRALRNQLPHCEIWGVVQPAARDWLLQTHWVDRVLTPEDRHLLPIFQPDLALGLSPRTATYRLLSASRARFRAGYAYWERPLSQIACAFWLTHTWRTSLRWSPDVPHEAEVVARFVQALGLAEVDPKPEFPVPQRLEQWGREVVRGRPVVHFAPRWLHSGRSLDDFYALAQALAPCLVTVGPAERALLPPQLPALGDVEWLENLSVLEWGAVLGAASFLVSTDTGAVHVAAARGTPVIVAYLPEHFELCSRQWYPWGVRSALLRLSGGESFLAELLQRMRSL